VRLGQLVSYPLIIQSEGTAGPAVVLHQFKKRGLKPMILPEVSNIELAKELERLKKDVAFMSEPNTRAEVASGVVRIIPVKDCEIKVRAIDLLTNREFRTFAKGSYDFLLRFLRRPQKDASCHLPLLLCHFAPCSECRSPSERSNSPRPH